MKRQFASLLCLAALAHAQHYAERNGWHFNNFSDPTYAWEIYRDTFIGIPPSYDPWSSAFDVLFYDQVYKDKLSANGNCYGMSLLSLMIVKKGGHLGYCQPIPQYSGDIFGGSGPSDAALRRAINIMHGHQVNLPTLQWILDIIAQNKNRDGAFAYSVWQDTRLKNDLALVSITETVNPSDGGHTMVAYDAQDLGGGNRRIYVYDPNRNWANPGMDGRGWYQAGQNFIQINGSSWTFTMIGTLGTWSGSPASGGNILITPASVTGPHSRSPASLGDQIIGKVLTQLLLTGAAAKIEQVTDANGKRLFRPGTLEVDTDPSTGMLNMVPWIPSDQLDRRRDLGHMFFRLGGPASALTVQVRAGDAGYTLWTGGPRNQVMVKSRGGRGADQITLLEPGAPNARIQIQGRRDADDYDVQFLQATAARDRVHLLRSSRLRIPNGDRVTLSTTASSQALQIESHAGTIQYDLELQMSTRQGVETLVKRSITQQPGLVRTARPRDWSDLKSRDVIEEIRGSRMR
jgi:hypothetical protein